MDKNEAPELEEHDAALQEYDAALYAETKTLREADHEFFYSYTKAHRKSASAKPSVTAQPARVHPKLAAYREKLDAISEKFNAKYPAFVFFYTGSKITPLGDKVKPAFISHDTQIVRK